MAGIKANTLKDSFTTSTLSACWSNFSFSGGSATGAGPGLVLAKDATNAFSGGWIQASDGGNTYDLASVTSTIEITTLPPDPGGAAAAFAFFQFLCGVVGDAGPEFDYYPAPASGPSPRLEILGDDATTTLTGTIPLFWRFRGSSDGLTIYAETATSAAGPWTQRNRWLKSSHGGTPNSGEVQFDLLSQYCTTHVATYNGGGTPYCTAVLPKTAAYSECFLAPDVVATAWDLNSFQGTIPVALPYTQADGVHLDGYWLSAFDNGGASLQLMDPLAATPSWAYDLRSSSVTIGIAQQIDPLANSGEAVFHVELGSVDIPSGPGATIVRMSYGGVGLSDTLRCVVTIDTSGSPDVYTLFSAGGAGEKHWRLRLAGNTLWADTSTDAVTSPTPTWSARGNLVDSRLPAALQAASIEFDTNFGPAVVRYFNVNCPVPAARARVWEIM